MVAVEAVVTAEAEAGRTTVVAAKEEAGWTAVVERRTRPAGRRCSRLRRRLAGQTWMHQGRRLAGRRWWWRRTTRPAGRICSRRGLDKALLSGAQKDLITEAGHPTSVVPDGCVAALFQCKPPGETQKALKGNFWGKSNSANSYRAEQLGVCAIRHLILSRLTLLLQNRTLHHQDLM